MSAFTVSRIGLPLSQVSARGHQVKVRLDPVGDLQQDVRPVRGTGLAPGVFRGMGGIQRQRHVGGLSDRATSQTTPPVIGVTLSM
jgi:hypothetical protein